MKMTIRGDFLYLIFIITYRRALASEMLQNDKLANVMPETSPTRVCPSVSTKLEAMPAFIALEPDKEVVITPSQQGAKPGMFDTIHFVMNFQTFIEIPGRFIH
jgi:hypothetical protein